MRVGTGRLASATFSTSHYLGWDAVHLRFFKSSTSWQLKQAIIRSASGTNRARIFSRNKQDVLVDARYCMTKKSTRLGSAYRESHFADNASTRDDAKYPASARPENLRFLYDNQDPALRRAVTAARSVFLSSGSVVIRQDEQCNHLILVLKGTLRVYRCCHGTREIFLYRIAAGEACPLTAAMLSRNETYPANAMVEDDAKIMLISSKCFHYAFHSSRDFREFICAQYAKRLGGFVNSLEQIALGNIEKRLSQWLLAHWDGDNPIRVSHRELSSELGTAREVVSRYLKEFEHCGWVRLKRRSIAISDHTGLVALASAHT